jgi:hypothetical protein
VNPAQPSDEKAHAKSFLAIPSAGDPTQCSLHAGRNASRSPYCVEVDVLLGMTSTIIGKNRNLFKKLATAASLSAQGFPTFPEDERQND